MARTPRPPRPPPEEPFDDEVPSPFGPYKNPVDRFAHLPEHTRAFIEELSREDLKTLEFVLDLLNNPETRDGMVALLRSFRNAGIIGKFFRWLAATAIAVFLTTVSFGEGIRNVWAWIFGR